MRIDFENVTVLYDENKINKEMCKKKNRKDALISLVISFLIFGFGFAVSCLSIEYIGEILSTITGAVLIVGLEAMYFWWSLRPSTKKKLKTYDFINWIFDLKHIEAGWFNGDILFRIWTPGGFHDRWLKDFMGCIENEIQYIDNSNKGECIHVIIDTRDEEKTYVSIKNNSDLNLEELEVER